MKNINTGRVCTCNKSSGDNSAGVETPGSLEFDSVLGGLSQPFQSYPRVLSIQYELLHARPNKLDPNPVKYGIFSVCKHLLFAEADLGEIQKQWSCTRRGSLNFFCTQKHLLSTGPLKRRALHSFSFFAFFPEN